MCEMKLKKYYTKSMTAFDIQFESELLWKVILTEKNVNCTENMSIINFPLKLAFNSNCRIKYALYKVTLVIMHQT